MHTHILYIRTSIGHKQSSYNIDSLPFCKALTGSLIVQMKGIPQCYLLFAYLEVLGLYVPEFKMKCAHTYERMHAHTHTHTHTHTHIHIHIHTHSHTHTHTDTHTHTHTTVHREKAFLLQSAQPLHNEPAY